LGKYCPNRPTCSNSQQLGNKSEVAVIDVSRIEKGRRQGDGWVGRCPACAEGGADTTGNHLKVWKDGRFSCVVNTGSEGAYHRKRIFALIGVKEGKRSHLPESPVVLSAFL
jgi:hypothetical protein